MSSRNNKSYDSENLGLSGNQDSSDTYGSGNDHDNYGSSKTRTGRGSDFDDTLNNDGTTLGGLNKGNNDSFARDSDTLGSGRTRRDQDDDPLGRKTTAADDTYGSRNGYDGDNSGSYESRNTDGTGLGRGDKSTTFGDVAGTNTYGSDTAGYGSKGRTSNQDDDDFNNTGGNANRSGKAGYGSSRQTDNQDDDDFNTSGNRPSNAGYGSSRKNDNEVSNRFDSGDGKYGSSGTYGRSDGDSTLGKIMQKAGDVLGSEKLERKGQEKRDQAGGYGGNDNY